MSFGLKFPMFVEETTWGQPLYL